MTLNQITQRIRTIAEAHQQVRSYQLVSIIQETENEHTRKYPAVSVVNLSGNVDTARREYVVNFRMFVVDLVNVSSETKVNEDEVLSDTLSIILDLIAQMSHPEYSDWRLSAGNSVDLLTESGGDMAAGWSFDFSIRALFTSNVCIVPSDLVISEIINENTLVYDYKYIGTGSEVRTITIPELLGKKVLFITREFVPLYKVSNLPDSMEYTWNNTDLVVGTDIGLGERFNILYRNY